VTHTLSKTRLDLIEAAGRLCQMIGMPRSTGQIYGLLYLSPKALTLDEIAELLGISKASASTGTRQLLALHAIRQVWKQGDRKDYLEAVPELREVVRAFYQLFFSPKLTKSRGRLDLLLESLEEERKSGTVGDDEYKFCRERLLEVSKLQGKVEKILPLAEKFI
jgi:DNA-binding transcriptional regulator GbsR (MarR family)